jgi:hypothetical protein
MAQENAQEDFDWVAAQAKCNAASMFARLMEGVKDDVQRRGRLFATEDGWSFEMHEDGGAYEVSRVVARGSTDSTVGALVRFARSGRRIHVQGDDVDVDFTAVVALDAGGVCRFVVGETIYSEWEIRRMALEQLFFEEQEAPE